MGVPLKIFKRSLVAWWWRMSSVLDIAFEKLALVCGLVRTNGVMMELHRMSRNVWEGVISVAMATSMSNSAKHLGHFHSHFVFRFAVNNTLTLLSPSIPD